MVEDANVPAAQSMHVEAEDAEYLPLAQTEHTDCPDNEAEVPAAQAVQEVLATTELYVPAAQSAHAIWHVEKLEHVGL